jgi:hypothetical protein
MKLLAQSPAALAAGLLTALSLFSCKPAETIPSGELPPIWPDYIGVTIPANIAPMNFGPEDGLPVKGIRVKVMDDEGKTVLSSKGTAARFPVRKWHRVIKEATGSSLSFLVDMKTERGWTRYLPFEMHVSPDPIDYGLTYRLIPPGYQSFGHMGIFERNLSNFRQRELLDTRMVNSGCINCHTQNRTDPGTFSLHIRGAHPATILRHDGKSECLNTRTDSTRGVFVYPYWHPSGKYIAYSTNSTKQSFYTAADKMLEGYDEWSDVIVYDVDNHTVLRPPQTTGDDRFDTWPAFSADGRTLYYSSSKAGILPRDARDLHYCLFSIDFDPASGSFGEKVDTLLDAYRMNSSFNLPRPSYDGKYILVTVSDFGTLQAGHREADLWLYDLGNGDFHNAGGINGNGQDSFHNWSSNSRWAVTCSRREEDKLYTRLYLAHLNDDGTFDKGFLLPQRNPGKYYYELIYSFNVPDFTSGKVRFNRHAVRKMVMSPERQSVKVGSIDQ